MRAFLIKKKNCLPQSLLTTRTVCSPEPLWPHEDPVVTSGLVPFPVASSVLKGDQWAVFYKPLSVGPAFAKG